tara:strand:- start:395 stop:1030 length:636 start_codon:yes stop_codon:yes gene_type:complete
MEPSPWDDLSENTDATTAPSSIPLSPAQEAPVAQQPMIMGATSQPYGQAQQPIVIQQAPSAAPKVIGILVIIYAAFSILGEGLGLIMPGANGLMVALGSANILAYAGMVFGAIQMIQYNRQGVFIVLGTILWIAISSVLAFQIAVDYDQMLENGELTEEEYEILTDDEVEGAVTVVGSIFVVFCNGICMAIVAIPLMISNNGFETKKTYGY